MQMVGGGGRLGGVGKSGEGGCGTGGGGNGGGGGGGGGRGEGGANGAIGGGGGGGGGGGSDLPHSQQFWEGTLNSGESAHSCPGMSALLAQCPSVTYDRHVPPYWFLQPGVSMQPTGAEAGGLPAAADSKVATPPFSFAGDCLAGEGGVPPSFPHTQQCFPASPKLAAAAHSWPVVKPAPLQWPSFTKSWHVPPYWLRHPGVSVQPPAVGIGNPASRKSAAQCRTARAHSTGAICGAHRHQDGGRPQGSYSIIIQYSYCILLF